MVFQVVRTPLWTTTGTCPAMRLHWSKPSNEAQIPALKKVVIYVTSSLILFPVSSLCCILGSLDIPRRGSVSRSSNWAAAAEDLDRKPDLLVDDDKVQCPAATFTSIQAAIDAASPGDLIRVCPGAYREQLSINKSLSIEGDNGAIVLPGNMTVNATGSSGTPIAAAILVKDAANVEIEGLIVDTANSGVSACSPDLIGILYQNASGSIEHNAVRNTKLAVSPNGCQSGD